MFHGLHFISQAGTTPIFKVFGITGPSTNRESNPQNLLLGPPIVAFYDQQGLLRTFSSPGGSIRSPHPGSPQGICKSKGRINVTSQGERILRDVKIQYSRTYSPKTFHFSIWNVNRMLLTERLLLYVPFGNHGNSYSYNIF